QAGDLAELSLKRGCNRGCDCLGISPWQLRCHLNGRRIHARKSRNRKNPVADDAEQDDGQHQQPGRYGPANERSGKVHGSMPELAVEGLDTASGCSGSASTTGVPGDSRYWPRTTTVSPALNPFSMSASAPNVWRTETCRIATLLS